MGEIKGDSTLDAKFSFVVIRNGKIIQCSNPTIRMRIKNVILKVVRKCKV